jgi:hypothetical protein
MLTVKIEIRGRRGEGKTRLAKYILHALQAGPAGYSSIEQECDLTVWGITIKDRVQSIDEPEELEPVFEGGFRATRIMKIDSKK